MTHRELITVPVFADGDICIDCNFSGQQVDFQHLHITLQECNMYNATPLNFENVTLIETPSFGKQSTPEPVITPTDPILASTAMAVFSMIQSSPKLTDAEKAGIQQLANGVFNVAGVTPDSGGAATALVLQLLNNPLMQAQPELSAQIQSALTQIQTVVAPMGGTL